MAIITEHGDHSKSGTVLPFSAVERAKRYEEETHAGATVCVRLSVKAFDHFLTVI